MSPKGRPTNDKKNKRFEIRLSERTYSILEKCSKELNLTKTEIIHKGIELVDKEIKK